MLMNPRIHNSIAPIVGTSQTLLTHLTKEVVAEAVCGGAWADRTPRQVIWTGVNGRTPGEVFNAVSVENSPSSVIIISLTTSPTFVISGNLNVSKKRQSASQGLGGNTKKLDTVVDVKLPNDLDYVPIFRKVIGQKLSDGSSDDLHLRCRINLSNDPIQTQAPHFIYMWLPAINTLNESGILVTPATSI